MPSNKKKSKSDRKDLKLGWHFLPADQKLGYEDGRKAKVGQTLSYNGAPAPRCCYRGMHASPKIVDAGLFGKGPVLCRVEVWGDVHSESNKFAGRHRKVLWMGTLTKSDFKELFKSVGYTTYNNDIDGYVDDLMSVCHEYKDKAEKWLQNWAIRNGLYTGRSKFVYVKPQVDKDVLRSLLNDRFVKTVADLKQDLGESFDMSTFDDALDDLAYMDGVCTVDGYAGLFEDGYVLERKKSTKKRK